MARAFPFDPALAALSTEYVITSADIQTKRTETPQARTSGEKRLVLSLLSMALSATYMDGDRSMYARSKGVAGVNLFVKVNIASGQRFVVVAYKPSDAKGKQLALSALNRAAASPATVDDASRVVAKNMAEVCKSLSAVRIAAPRVTAPIGTAMRQAGMGKEDRDAMRAWVALRMDPSRADDETHHAELQNEATSIFLKIP